MPTYTYETIPEEENVSCRRFEIEQRMSEPALSVHPETGEKIRRLITGGTGLLLGKAAGDSSCGMGACEPAPMMSRPCCGGGCRGHS